ncbi:MAG TPA: Gfo/Idh/MocA family oxidoreductase [Thermoanaerobaculia bacterium]|nr:Gfo/Idh/MocA family oxidoreductase [Thermoanaerobaculia bacterium]
MADRDARPDEALEPSERTESTEAGASRREFLRSSTLLGAALGAGGLTGCAASGATGEAVAPAGAAARVELPPPPDSYARAEGFAAPPLELVRMAFVGVGLQGGSHVRNFLRIEGVEIVAICDIDEPRAREVAGWVETAGRPSPALYTDGEVDWRRLLERGDVDLVFNATPWRWHVPVCVGAMEAGMHTAVEVPAAYRLEDCWRLVETAERSERHCVMMENCNYGRAELMVLNLVRQGVLGELLHAEGAYIHDLRAIKFSDANEGLWRLEHSKTRNGNLYPTHGLGPVANCLDVNRGDRFDYLVSMSTPQRGLTLYATQRFGADDPRARQSYALGDMSSSLIKTARGRTILVQHDTTSPRPYSRLNLVQGTKGTFSGYPDKIYLEGVTEGHGWEHDLEALYAKYEHPLWRKLRAEAEGAGHGGMDYLEDYRLIECLRGGEPTDMDVYDAASLSAVCELSEISVANRSQPVDFPDFTRGRWQKRKPLGIVS